MSANPEEPDMTSKYVRVLVVWVVTIAALYVFQAAYGQP
jgi:hypothetical protein